MAKYALIDIHDANFEELSQMTWDNNKKLYAERHGYATFIKTNNFAPTVSFGWQRLIYILEVLENNPELEWVWMTGTDAMVTNFNTKIEDKIDNNCHFMVATDFNSINVDSMLFRNSPEGKGFLRDVISLEPLFRSNPLHENAAVIHILGLPEGLSPWPAQLTEKYRNVARVMNQKYMNSYDYSLYYNNYPHCRNNLDRLGQYGNWEIGDWLIQWPATTMHHRFQLARNFASKVVQ
jgi:galactosyl transferase GMA12/MNN10 family